MVAAHHRLMRIPTVLRGQGGALNPESDHFQHTNDLVLQYLARQKAGTTTARKRGVTAEATA